MQIIRAWLLLAVSSPIMACGGRAAVDGGQGGPSAAGAANAGAASGGNAAGGGTASGGTASGGTASGGGASAGAAGVECSPDAANILCVASCGDTTVSNYIYSTCVNGTPVCPTTLSRIDACPPDACIHQDRTCCDPVYGTQTNTPCGPHGLFAACPAGTKLTTNGCYPDSAGTTACTTLADTACTVNGALCASRDGTCNCVPAPHASLVWRCAVNAN